MVDFAAAGLGLQYGTVRLARTDEGWATIAGDLASELEKVLGGLVAEVEHVGSTAVPGLLAKPIIDLALAVEPGVSVDDVAEALAALGWTYRGDAGEDGGWVFVLEDAPWHRVAHAHGVPAGGVQWRNYLELRELLRRSPEARATYASVKQRLAEQHPDGRRQYTAGKDATVRQLLAGG